MKSWWLSQRNIAISLIVVSIIGLVASFALGRETLQVIKDPNYVPSCDLNPIVSCGNAMGSAQAEMFGVPNPVFGLMGFAALMTMAVILLIGGTASRKVWALIGLGALGGVAFMKYLFIVSMTVTNSICPWCAVLWVASVLLFWLVATYMAANKMLDFNKWSTKMARLWVKYAGPILIVWYLILIAIIFIRFQDYWLSLI